MIDFLIFYYFFSVLFQLGYIDYTSTTIFQKILLVLIAVILAPVLVPFNLGYYVYNNIK